MQNTTTTATKPDTPKRQKRTTLGRPLGSATHDAATTPAQRAALSFAMRQTGLSWVVIGRQLGYANAAGARGAALRHALLPERERIRALVQGALRAQGL